MTWKMTHVPDYLNISGACGTFLDLTIGKLNCYCLESTKKDCKKKKKKKKNLNFYFYLSLCYLRRFYEGLCNLYKIF